MVTITFSLILLLFAKASFASDDGKYSYDPESPIGPSHWEDVAPSCGGNRQSPIDLKPSSALPLLSDNLKTTTSAIPSRQTVANLDQTLKIKIDEITQQNSLLSGSTLRDDTFSLLQIHYHSPSEHTIDYKPYDLEAHYVHIHKETGRIAVLGVLYEIGDYNEDLQTIVALADQIPQVGNETSALLKILAPTFGGSFWYYPGSLTTPPCHEVVDWFVFQKVLSVSQDQLNQIKSRLDSKGFPNNRPIQSLNGRNIYQKVTTYSYDDDSFDGPSNWHRFWPDCGGKSQSPINFIPENTVHSPLPGLSNNASSKFLVSELVNKGHTVQVNPASSSSSVLTNSTLMSDEYELIQFHFHAPSEHTVNNINYPVEVHYVHINQGTGRLAVVGMFYELKEECNNDLQPIINALPSIQQIDHLVTILVKNRFNDEFGKFWHYRGSLTTPPCSEIVDWFVFQHPQPICQSQLENLTHAMHHGDTKKNNRPVQDLNQRIIYVTASASRLAASSFLLFSSLLAFFFSII